MSRECPPRAGRGADLRVIFTEASYLCFEVGIEDYCLLIYRAQHSVVVDDLPMYNVAEKRSEYAESLVVKVDDTTTISPCDVCPHQNDEEQQLLSTKYCFTCEKKLCDEHYQVIRYCLPCTNANILLRRYHEVIGI